MFKENIINQEYLIHSLGSTLSTPGLFIIWDPYILRENELFSDAKFTGCILVLFCSSLLFRIVSSFQKSNFNF